MGYKQKYKDVLEKLRDFYRDYDTVSHLIDVKEELANLFPELKEPKEEQIRKRLIKAFGSMVKKQWGGIAIEDILAWLEKQGEQKIDNSNTMFNACINVLRNVGHSQMLVKTMQLAQSFNYTRWLTVRRK